MPKSFGRLWALALVSVLPYGIAVAGPLPTDPAAIAAVQGTATINGQNAGATNTFKALVDYAVYAPGTFSTSGLAFLNFPADISGGTEYIYAYEVFNVGVDESLTLLSVGLFTGGVANASILISNLAGTPEGGVAPINSSFNPAGNVAHTNARWTFSSTGANDLGIGDHSDILIFASPNPPQWKTSSITGTGATAGSALLPTPVPEPATYALAAIGAICLFAVRSLRRRHSVG